jgi:uncharacterized protein (TIGR02246 family)
MTRTFLRLSFAVALAALAFPVFAADQAAHGAKSLDAAWVKAMKANDLEGVLKCYAADAFVYMPDAPVAQGEKAIRALYEGLLSANTIQEAETMDTHYATSGDVSTGWGNFRVVMAPKKGGASVTMAGRFTEVARKRGGKWVYVADHASHEPAPTAPAK